MAEPSIMKKYTCPTCKSVIVNNKKNIGNHNKTIKHRKGLVNGYPPSSEEFKAKERIRVAKYRKTQKEMIGGILHEKFKYLQGKVYKVYSPRVPNLQYIGSTITKLQDRFSHHRSTPSNDYMCKFMTKYDDVVIELIENYPCFTLDELLNRERTITNIVRKSNGIVLNKVFMPPNNTLIHTPLCTIKFYKEKHPEYSLYFDSIIARDYLTL